MHPRRTPIDRLIATIYQTLMVALLFALMSVLAPRAWTANDLNLPLLGDTTSSIISPQQEYELGRAWLAAFRSRVKTLDDPELQFYLENLLYDLAEHSELEDHRLDLVLINNPTLNAFAVPGGVVGVHTGLFQHAENEAQLSAVLAHELAHLSQRHFARSLETRKASTVGTMAGLLAGIILAATVGGDAGMAAMTMTQAAALEHSLRYSRQNEQEADRIGIDTLFQSGRDPGAVSAMFENMLAATRYTGQRPPEFLLTHPLTEKRVADARGRIQDYPSRQYTNANQYYFMRARAQLWLDKNPQKSIQRFSSEMEGHTSSKAASTYGLALALSQAGDHQRARETLQPLIDKDPENLSLQFAALELDKNQGHYSQALARISSLENLHGSNTALQRLKAEIYLQNGQYQDSMQTLETLSKKRPTDPNIWFQLAETSGLAGDIVGVHQARAEYFILIGVYDKAREHINYAKRLMNHDFRKSALLDKRLEEVEELIERQKKL